MKSIKFNNSKITYVLGLVLILSFGCERDLSDDAVEASFSSEGEIFIDNFVGMGTNFYLPFADSKLDAFSVDNDEGFESSASYRVDVPNASDPTGSYAGAILRVDGAGRDLSGYDALTFWAKASQGVNVDAVGFGQDFLQNEFQVTANNLSIGTNWAKYTIPIPDASKLVEERGVFWYAAGTQATNGSGYVIWFDEIKFESLGTIAHPRPKIFDGNDMTQQTFNLATINIYGLTQTFNLANGINQTVAITPGYFEFTSSNPNVATVNELGVITVNSPGTTVITATLDGVDAQGSLTLTSLGDFTPADTPDEDPANVISIFSDAYNNVPVDYYNGFFNGDGQTTQGGVGPGGADISINGNGIINYTQLNFVGIGTFLNVQPIDATQMTHIHVDINVQEAIDSGDQLTLQLLNGVQTANELSGSVVLNSSELTSNGWESFDIPLGNFGLGARDALGLLFFNSTNSANVPTISNIYVDNIYFYKEVIDPSPNVDDSAATEVSLPVGFESTTLTYQIGVFGGADSAVEVNPDQSGINPTSTILRSTKTVGAEFFAGTTLQLDAPVDFSTSQVFRMKVWSPKAGIPVRIKLENSANSAQFIELDANTTTTNEWEELEWDFSNANFNVGPLDIVVIFFEFVPGTSGDGSVYYCDDLKILN
ncbi:Ig-like domain-containing protein [uncultured Winogradskyella sp.]|uniref:Ig-like domain-containing protein n=1 Tax=uncultured Winogradskyella sp. TaxID=395353 RepID=UPI002614D4A3|nr:Ig-like domain-containing protein [uncultured Winogradskyella sp.]